jgi:hypothetical protein
MLFVHDVHAVIGENEFDFENLVRAEYAAKIDDHDTRFMWYLYATHGAGDAYHVVTVTGLRDGTAWERLVDRLRYGNLSRYSIELDRMTYSSQSSLLASTEWSPLAAHGLEDLPDITDAGEIRAFREDTLIGTRIELEVDGQIPNESHGETLTCLAGFRSVLAPDQMIKILYRIAPQSELEPIYGKYMGWQDWSGSLTPTLPDGVRSSGRMLRNISWSA